MRYSRDLRYSSYSVLIKLQMKNIVKLLLVIGLSTVLGSCGLFHKKCDCPHFGRTTTHTATNYNA